MYSVVGAKEMRGHFFITMGYGILLPLRAFRSQGLLFFFVVEGVRESVMLQRRLQKSNSNLNQNDI